MCVCANIIVNIVPTEATEYNSYRHLTMSMLGPDFTYSRVLFQDFAQGGGGGGANAKYQN